MSGDSSAATSATDGGQGAKSASPSNTQTRPSSMSVNDLLSRPSSSQGAREAARSEQANRSTSQADQRPSHSRDGEKNGGGGGARPQLSQTSSSASLVTPSLGRESFSSRRPITPMGSGGVEISSSENVNAYQYAAVQQITENRKNIEYILSVREQPKHSRMCGVGEKADRRPIDPAPIIQLRVIVHDHPCPTKKADSHTNKLGSSIGDESKTAPLSDARSGVLNALPAMSSSGGTDYDSRGLIRRGVPVRTEWGEGWEDKTWYLENPYYFMYAMLADAETDEELHLLGDRRTRYTTGSCVSCLYHLKDIDGTEQGFFVFPDLSIRVEGCYRLKLCLFETIGHEVHHCKSIYSQPFNVYTAKRFPGMEESTPLSKSFADQGLKVRVRKNPRARRARAAGGGKRKGDSAGSDDDSDSNGQPQLVDPRDIPYRTGSNVANKRVRSDAPQGRPMHQDDDGGAGEQAYMPHAHRYVQGQYPEHTQQSRPLPPPPPSMMAERRGMHHQAAYGYAQGHPPLPPHTEVAAYRADRERREYGQPASMHGPGVPPFAPHQAHGRPPMHDQSGRPIDNHDRPQIGGYIPADRTPAHLRPALESRRSEPHRPSYEQGPPRPPPHAAPHDLPPFRERAGGVREADRRMPPAGMSEAEHHYRMQAMQRPLHPPPEALGVPSWQMPRSVSPVHTRAALQNDYARDRSISDPYRGAHGHHPGPASGLVPGPGRPANEEQRQRLPPLHVALSPEMATRSAHTSPSDMHYYPRSGNGGSGGGGGVNRPQIPSPLQQHSGMPGLQPNEGRDDGWDRMPPSKYGPASHAGPPPPPPPPHQQFYHRPPQPASYAQPPPPPGQQPGPVRSLGRAPYPGNAELPPR